MRLTQPTLSRNVVSVGGRLCVVCAGLAVRVQKRGYPWLALC